MRTRFWAVAATLATVSGTLLSGTAPVAIGAPRQDVPSQLHAAANQLVNNGYPGVITYTRHDQQVWRVTAGVSDLRTGRPAG